MKYKEGFTVWLEAKGSRVIGEEEARLLEAISLFGSIMKASRCLGISYAHAWALINRVQDAIGKPIVRTRKGGASKGGAELTRYGKDLLERYLRLEERVERALRIKKGRAMREPKLADLIVVGSDCPALRLLLEFLKRRSKVEYEYEVVGSSGGFAAIMMRDADLAGVHLLSEDGTYNEPFLRLYWLEGRAKLIGGYKRVQGLMFRRGLKVGGMDDIFGMRFVNRNLGSGTRVLFDLRLKELAKEKGVEFEELASRIRGYEVEVRSHEEVAEAVRAGRADVGFGLECVAEEYGLGFVPLAEERFDFLVRADRIGKPSVSAFIRALRSEWFRRALKGLKGIEACEWTGRLF